MDGMNFNRELLSLGGGDVVSVLVARENGTPRTVYMSYEAFQELAATLYAAFDELKMRSAA